MNTSDFAAYLLTLPLAQYRRIRKAYLVLLRAGVMRDDAIHILLENKR